MTRIAPRVITALALGLSACTNPYDPVQRGFAGGLWGAASGAAIGAAAGGGPGAALGAAVGGATGIFGGVASTPPPPGTYYGYGSPAYGYPPYGYPGYGYRAYPPQGYGYPRYSGAPAYAGPPSYAYQGGLGSRITPLPPTSDIPATRNIPPTSVRQGTDQRANLGRPGYPAFLPYSYQDRPLYPPYAGSGYGSPAYGYPGNRASEDWSPGAGYGAEPDKAVEWDEVWLGAAVASLLFTVGEHIISLYIESTNINGSAQYGLRTRKSIAPG